MMRISVRLSVVLLLTATLSFSLVDLFAKPWRQTKTDDLLVRAERAICFEQPEAAGRLLAAAERLDSEMTSERRTQIAADQSRVIADTDFARQYFQQCGNVDRVAVLDAVQASYPTPKAALNEALELANRGEYAYARQLVALAGSMNPDYAGVKAVSDYLDIE